MPEYDSTISYKPVPSHPGYFAGSDGTIWSCRKAGICRLLKPQLTNKGYYCVSVGWPRKLRYVHRLVLEAFIGPCPKNTECRHFPDQSRTNNFLDNLSWCTFAQNQADRKSHGTDNRGSKHGYAKLNEKQVIDIRESDAVGVKKIELSKRYGVSYSTIWDIVTRKRWKHI